MKYTRDALKQMYKAGEITIKEFKEGLKDIEEKERDRREKLLERLENPQEGD